jgi:hypothetical protein
MEKTTSAHFRIPVDVLGPARTRAAAEHRTLTDVVVRYLREYGSGITVNEAPAVKPKRPARARKPATSRPAPAAADLDSPAKPARASQAGPESADGIMAALRRKGVI